MAIRCGLYLSGGMLARPDRYRLQPDRYGMRNTLYRTPPSIRRIEPPICRMWQELLPTDRPHLHEISSGFLQSAVADTWCAQLDAAVLGNALGGSLHGEWRIASADMLEGPWLPDSRTC